MTQVHPPTARLAILAALLALAAGSFALKLEFAQDDYWFIPSADAQLRNFVALPVEGSMPQVKPDSPVVQPVLALALSIPARVLPHPIAAGPFHLLALLVHAANAYLLCRVLTRRTSSAVGLAAALLFALNPAGMQAWTWVSASGGAVAICLSLAALDRVDRKPAAELTPWIVGSLAAAAILSQRAGLMLGALVIVVSAPLLTGSARQRRWPGLLLPLLIGLILFSLGGGFGYIGGTHAGLAAVPEILAALPRLASDLFTARMAVEGATPALLALPAWCFVVPWFLLGLAALPFAGRGVLRALAVLASAALPAALHWSMLVATGSTASGSRSLYIATAALAFLAATLVASAGQHGGWRRGLAWTAIALIGIGFVDQFMTRAQDELSVATEIRSFRESADSLCYRLPAGAPVLIADASAARAGIPLVSAGFMPEACRPPFTWGNLNVSAFGDTSSLLDAPLLREHQGPLVIWSRTDAEPVILPALPTTAPELVRSGVPDVWMPRAAMPGRALAAVVLRPAPMAPLTGVRVKTERGEIVAYARDRGGQEGLTLGFDDSLHLLAAEEIISITTHGALDLPPQLLARMPDLEHDTSLEPALLSAGTVPALVMAARPEVGDMRVDCRFKIGDYAFSAAFRLAIPQSTTPTRGPLRLPLASAALINTTQPGFSFESAGALAAKILRPFGLSRISFLWRATLLAAGSESPVARSPWRAAVLSLAP